VDFFHNTPHRVRISEIGAGSRSERLDKLFFDFDKTLLIHG
jgi:hypothetical protein